MSRPTWLNISSSALRHNLKRVRELAPESKIMFPVKCDAYGHGIHDVVPILADCDAFAVACLEEAQSVRSLTDKPVVLLEGVYHQSELDWVKQGAFEIVVHSVEQLALLENYQGNASFQVWLKINTGMCRLGVSCAEVRSCWDRLLACRNVNDTPRLMTHFSHANDPKSPITDQQIQLFYQTTDGFEAACSLANSAGILGWPQAHAQWVRPGIMLYGISPFIDTIGRDHGLIPSMTMRTSIIAKQCLKKGDVVGYGGLFQCPTDMPVGIIAIGYGDGYPHALPNGTPVLLNNRSAALVGAISMDMAAIDLRNHPDAQVGDEVILWGADLPIEELATRAGTIPYELFCNIHPRIHRYLVE